MIRFINLTGQILIDDDEPHFAWFDTISNKFLILYGNQEWHSWEEFELDLTTYLKTTSNRDKKIKRFKKLYQFKTHPTKTSPSLKE